MNKETRLILESQELILRFLRGIVDIKYCKEIREVQERIEKALKSNKKEQTK